jgi:hypothetical protein
VAAAAASGYEWLSRAGRRLYLPTWRLPRARSSNQLSAWTQTWRVAEQGKHKFHFWLLASECF